jgi:hypothetical protein
MTIDPQDTCRRIIWPTAAIVRTHRHGQGMIPLEDMCRLGGGLDGLLAVKDVAQTSRSTRHRECSGRSSCAAWSTCQNLTRPGTTCTTRTGRLQRRPAACPVGPCGSARDRRQKPYPTAGGEEPNNDAISERQHS